MKFILALNMAEAEQETVWLQERLSQDDIQNITSDVLKSPAKEGGMSGGMLTNMLELVATTTVAEVIKAFIGYLFEHFKGKQATLELSGVCPDTGRELKLSFDTNSSKSRDAAIVEFERTYNSLCLIGNTTTENAK